MHFGVDLLTTRRHNLTVATRLYIGNLPYSTSSLDLAAAFGHIGQLLSAQVVMDKMTGRSKGFGFVTFAHSDEATTAVQVFNGRDMDGRPLTVNVARDIEPRIPRSGRDRWPTGPAEPTARLRTPDNVERSDDGFQPEQV